MRLFMISMLSILVAGCATDAPPVTQDTISGPTTRTIPVSGSNPGTTTMVGLPNPASVNCTKQGGKLELVQTQGGTAGHCIFPSGKICEEWALMRGECLPDPSDVKPASGK